MPMPECQCQNANAGFKLLATGRNADAGLTFFRHLLIIPEVYLFLHYSSARSTSMDCVAENIYEAPYLVTLHPWAILRTAKLYAALYWATLYPTELHCILFWAPLSPLSYTAPSELHCTMLSYDAACWATLSHLLSYAVPFWTALNLLSNAALYWAAGHFTELRCTLLSYTVPTKLRCALLS